MVIQTGSMRCVGPLTISPDSSVTLSTNIDRVEIDTYRRDPSGDLLFDGTLRKQFFGPFQINVIMDSLAGAPRFAFSEVDVKTPLGRIMRDVEAKRRIEDFLNEQILGPLNMEWRDSEDIDAVGEMLKKYKGGATGFTSDISGNYWRMFDFSAITITTVGYGDIIPITPEARRWVTAEAISGVVTIGLFLNSLFQS